MASAQATTLRAIALRLSRCEPRIVGDPETRVVGLCQDSRELEAGEIFVVREGQASKGEHYIPEALRRGASALLVGRGGAARMPDLPRIEVESVEAALAPAAEAAFGDPSSELPIVGVTGTNGKTTTTWLLQQAINGAGGRAARLGTLGFDGLTLQRESNLTTPEADRVAKYQALSLRAGASHFVMEVSSHALTQGRVAGTRFEVAAFTNLSQDHLDYHPDLEAYFAAKCRLFTELEPRVSVVHVRDAYGERLARLAHGRVITCGMGSAFDVHPVFFQAVGAGLQARIKLPSCVVDLRAPLTGHHNLENCLVTLAVVEALGLGAEQAAHALASMPQVPGRMERCEGEGDDLCVIVDYAHTPEALMRALEAARPFTRGKLICVFGCGGDRDTAKRPLMGAQARDLADFTFITSDNPRSEEPELIARAIEQAFSGHSERYAVELDRKAAIEAAILGAAPSDTVLICGKGHERYQILGDTRTEFDDREQARLALAQRRLTRERA